MLYDAVMNDEPLKIGIVAPAADAAMFRHLFPEAVWCRYESLHVLSSLAERDEVDLLVIDASQLERGENLSRQQRLPISEENDLLDLICRHYPILVVLAPDSAVPSWARAEGVAVLRNPVAWAALLDHLAAQEARIRTGRLRRLFQKVAAAFPSDFEWRMA